MFYKVKINDTTLNIMAKGWNDALNVLTANGYHKGTIRQMTDEEAQEALLENMAFLYGPGYERKPEPPTLEGLLTMFRQLTPEQKEHCLTFMGKLASKAERTEDTEQQ